MSTLVCETQHHSLPPPMLPKHSSHYLWPTAATERQGRPPALRIVTSETTPSPSRSSDSKVSEPGVRACSSPRMGSSNVESESVRHEQVRLPVPDAAHSAGERPVLSFPQRASHSHTKSATAVGVSNANATFGFSSGRTYRRARAASSATVGPTSSPHARLRLPSMLESVLTLRRAPAQPYASVNDPDLVGSFAPTSSPRPRLRSLLSGFGATPALPSPLHPTPPASRYGTGQRRPRYQSDAPRHKHVRTASETQPVEEPPASPDLPSICRTPSSYTGSDYFPTAPSSAGPSTPVNVVAALPMRKSESLHPVLENLERGSVLRVQTACATCGQKGSNFPCCPKCGEMWCSRACRLQKGDGKRHICSKKSS